MIAIQVDQLSKSYPYYTKEAGLKHSLRNLFRRERLEKDAVKGISFAIEEGEMVGFLGPNGAGKTTTLKMLAGILHPSSGSASVLGHVPWERSKRLKMQFSIVMGQKNQLWWDLPANESFLLNRYMYEIDEQAYRRTLDELTELLDVKELLGVQVRKLSLGERMKMELIASLLHRPKVVFLDEPTIGLDFMSQKKIRDFLKYYNLETNMTVILTSHYMNDIEDLCKRSIIINNGRLVYDGELRSVNEIVNEKKLLKLKFEEPVGREQLARFGIVKEYEIVQATIEVERELLKASTAKILEQLPVLDLNIEDIPIEEGIARLYRKGGTEHERVG
ncbi:ABC transporter ATP-binding protein [Paenibacillus xanthanilyticus]|uniref:ATP-binding cassette domain-containing protein n=1 Tax=Paenibacillus xanthanilyticus TaxID=1783531 RepID=A0ABV8K5Y2_9BACL